MIKKILLILFISILVFSCGKKSNPLRDGKPVENPKFEKE